MHELPTGLKLYRNELREAVVERLGALPADEEAVDARALGPADVLPHDLRLVARVAAEGRVVGLRALPRGDVEPDVVVGEHRRPARIGHPFLLSQLGTFPARELIARWLTAGVVEDGRLTPTGEGTPQGGVISPCLLNVVLHGMEDAAGVCYQRSGTDAAAAAAGSPVLVRYADDRVPRTRLEVVM